MQKTAIIGAARTPFGKRGGGVTALDATDLVAAAISAAPDGAPVKVAGHGAAMTLEVGGG